MRWTTHAQACGSVVLGVVLGSGSWASAQVVVDGEVQAVRGLSLRAYSAGAALQPAVHTETFISPGAEFVRLHFVKLDLAPGDRLVLSGMDGTHAETLTGRGPHGDGDV